MNEVLILAKTRMKNAICIGAYDITNKRNLRLLTHAGKNQPINTQFNVGQVWGMDYINSENITKPHTEDVLLQKTSFVKNIENMSNFLLKNMPIWKGCPTEIFDNCISFPHGKSGRLERKNSHLAQSVGFWVADKNIELSILNNKKHYFYFGDRQEVFCFPYVGTMDKMETIPKGTIIRVSLARWWSPSKNKEKGCYCQISGWY